MKKGKIVCDKMTTRGEYVGRRMLPFLLVVGLICLLYYAFGAPKREQQARQAEAAADRSDEVTATVRAKFGTWSATTLNDGVALNWSGAASELVWVERNGDFDRPNMREWFVWAKTRSDQLYVVTFGRNPETRQLEVRGGPIQKEAADLLQALVARGETGLIERLKLPRKDA